MGADNFFLFGLTVEQIEALKPEYDPASMIREDENLDRVFRLIDSGAFNAFEPGIFDAIVAGMRDPRDPWMTIADAAAYFAAQEAAAQLWRNSERFVRMSILNTAASGRFSADRTIRAYNEDIWRLEPLEL